MQANNDPNLPSYKNLAYRDLEPLWELCADVAAGMDRNNGSRYLPRDQAEPETAYKNRLANSVYLWEPRFSRTVDDFAAILSCVHTSDDIPTSLANRLENIDRAGSALDSFMQRANRYVNIFGGCFILVDYAGKPTAQDGAEELGSDRSPYLVRYCPQDILNWRTEYIDGTPVLKQVTIRQEYCESLGDFGEQEITRYRVLTPGLSQLWEVQEDDAGKAVAVLVDEAAVTDRSGNLLTEIPIAYYSLDAIEPFVSEPPFLPLAKLNVHLWQLESDRFQVMHNCNLPTPVVEDDEGLDTMGNPQRRQLVLGANSFISVSKGGKAYFIEPSGGALAATKEKVDDVKASMDKLGLDFLFGQLSNTATQSLLQATGTQANLKGMARELNSTLSEILRLWCLFTNEEVTGEITVDDGLLQMPLSADMGRFIVDLLDTGKLTYQTAMAQLQRGKLLDEEIDLEAEELALSEADAARVDSLAAKIVPTPRQTVGMTPLHQIVRSA